MHHDAHTAAPPERWPDLMRLAIATARTSAEHAAVPAAAPAPDADALQEARVDDVVARATHHIEQHAHAVRALRAAAGALSDAAARPLAARPAAGAPGTLASAPSAPVRTGLALDRKG